MMMNLYPHPLSLSFFLNDIVSMRVPGCAYQDADTGSAVQYTPVNHVGNAIWTLLMLPATRFSPMCLEQ